VKNPFIERVVSERALQQRINRALRKRDEALCKTRGGDYDRFKFGDYHVLDCQRNIIIERHVHLEDLGKELGVLGANERVAVEDSLEDSLSSEGP
jgi:hypothetical protein